MARPQSDERHRPGRDVAGQRGCGRPPRVRQSLGGFGASLPMARSSHTHSAPGAAMSDAPTAPIRPRRHPRTRPRRPRPRRSRAASRRPHRPTARRGRACPGARPAGPRPALGAATRRGPPGQPAAPWTARARPTGRTAGLPDSRPTPWAPGQPAAPWTARPDGDRRGRPHAPGWPPAAAPTIRPAGRLSDRRATAGIPARADRAGLPAAPYPTAVAYPPPAGRPPAARVG